MSGTEQAIPVSQHRGGVPAQISGFGIAYRVIKMRVDGFDKPPEEVTFEDLWTYTPDGVLVPRDPARVVQDKVTRNKFLKRGLSWLCHLMLRNKAGVTEAERNLPDIAGATRSKNPFRALILVADSDINPLYGDTRVLWNESDGVANTVIPSSKLGAFTPAGYGIRGCLLDESTDPLKIVQVRYPNTTYYNQLEYTVFAKANSSPVETGAQGIDNFPIKSLGIAYGIAAGFDDADSQWASRAILGLYPTIQGWLWPTRVGVDGSKKGTDRPYCHENYVYDDAGSGSVTALHTYTGTETIPGNGDGYVVSNEEADGSLAGDINISITPNAADQFTAATRQVKLGGATFTDQHAIDRLTLKITGTTSNNKDFTVKRRVTADTVEVFETVVDEGPGAVGSATLVSRHTGDKAFDGRVENQGKVYPSVTDDGDPDGEIIMGQNWRSADAPSGHFIGRVWNASKSVRGVRVICGKGTPREHCLDRFKIQYLDPTANGGSPRPAQSSDWLDVAEHVYTSTGPVLNIYPAGQYGYEFHFSTPRTTQGIRLVEMQNEAQNGYVELQQILIYEEPASHAIASPNNVLKVAVDGASTFKSFTIPAVAATQDLQEIVDALNQVLLGWELEAVRTEFGFLLIRATVEGNNSKIELDSTGGGSTINASLGFPTAGRAEDSGVTQPITKVSTEALTLIVTADYTIDLPWAT